jgi:hypothetical protein
MWRLLIRRPNTYRPFSRGIANFPCLEEDAHLGRHLLQAVHMRAQEGFRPGLVLEDAAPRQGLLEVVVHELVGIVLRRIGRQINQFDPMAVGVHPGGHRLGVMDAQGVDDEEDFAPGVFYYS